jgi:hypothetical protein
MGDRFAEELVVQSSSVVSGSKPAIVNEYPSRHWRVFCLDESNAHTAGVICTRITYPCKAGAAKAGELHNPITAVTHPAAAKEEVAFRLIFFIEKLAINCSNTLIHRTLMVYS